MLEYKLEKIKIELTDHCPLDCLHCSSNSTADGKIFLNVDKVKEVIKEAEQIGLKKVVFTGGEPLLYPSICELILFCSDRNIETTLYSTGINSLNFDNNIDNVLEELKKVGLNRIIFTLVSSKEGEHENITRTTGSFDKTLNAIIKSTNNNLKTELHFVPLLQNFRSLENLVDFALELGITRISILRFVSQGRAVIIDGISTLTKKEYIIFRNILKGINKKYPELIRLGSPFNFLLLRDIVKCNAGINQIIVNPKGYIFPCDAFKNIYPKSLGIDDEYNSIIDHSVIEIWKNSKYLNYIRSIITKDKTGSCIHCKYLKDCGSGCLAQKIIRNNSFMGKDPDCLKNGG